MKICSKCKVEKSFDNFRIRKDRKVGYRSSCKQCDYEYERLNRKDYFKNYQKGKRLNNSNFRIAWNIRASISMSFKRSCNGKYKKSKKTEEVLGCTIKEFTIYLQSLFLKGMNLDNYGKWHIDHIIPISSAKSEEEIIRLNHYTNFQPLWAEDNFKKSNKIIEKQLKLI